LNRIVDGLSHYLTNIKGLTMLSITILLFSIVLVAAKLASDKIEFAQLLLILSGLSIGLSFY
jgi:hypothetical protein